MMTSKRKSWGVFFDAAGTLIASDPKSPMGVALFEDVLPTLDLFLNTPKKGCHFQLGVITNWGNRVHAILETVGLKSYFSSIVSADDVGQPKPHVEIFQHGAKSLDLLPNDCFFVGDSFYDDAVGSCKAGFQGVWLNRRGTQTMEQNMPIPTVHTLVDFYQWVLDRIDHNGSS